MNEEKNVVKSQSDSDNFNEEKYLWDVLDSNISAIEKIRKIADNPRSDPHNIIEALLAIGPFPAKYFENEALYDYIATNWLRFKSLDKLITELKESGEYQELSKLDKKFMLDVNTAIGVFKLYAFIDDTVQTEDDVNPEVREKIYNAGVNVIEIFAEYFESARLKENNDVVYYRVGETKKLKDALKKFAEAEEIDENDEARPNTNDAEQSDEKRHSVTQPTSSVQKQSKLPTIMLGISGGAFVISLILAMLGMSVGNYLLIAFAIIDVIAAIIIIGKVDKKALLTCPECGTQRVHHRKYLETTKSEKFFDQNYNKSPDQSIRCIYGYTHRYLSTYTCPKCGNETQVKTSDGGGCVTVYYSGRRKDTRTQPREF